MKILITSKGNNFLDAFDIRFGRCDYFILYDTELNIFKAIKNNEKEVEQEAGVKASQRLLELKPDVVLTGRLGPKARMCFEENNVEVCLLKGNTVAEVVEKYKEEKKYASCWI